MRVSPFRLSITTEHLTTLVYLRPPEMPPIPPLLLELEPSAEASASLMMLALEPPSSKLVLKAV